MRVQANESHPLWDYGRVHFQLLEVSLFRKPLERSLHEILTWNKQVLTTSMKHLPSDLTSSAIQASRNISGFMGTRSTGKRRHDHVLKLLRNVISAPEELRDEVLCQLCKQTTENPDPAATRNGWQMMAVCLATFGPTQTLRPYLEAYCQANLVSEGEVEVGRTEQYVADCLASLEKGQKYEKRVEIPSMDEVHAIIEHVDIDLAFYLIDGSYKIIAVNSWTTCKEICNEFRDQFQIEPSAIADLYPFRLYEVSSSKEVERVVEMNERILDLYTKWQRLYSQYQTKKKKLKRRVLATAEEYSLVYKAHLYLEYDGDLIPEVNLTYMQAVDDVIRGKYCCSIEDYTTLAAIQLLHDHGEYVEENVASVIENLHKYLPENLLEPVENVDDPSQSIDPEAIMGEVVEKYAEMPVKTTQQSELAYLQLCQSWKLYGCTFFRVENKRNREWNQSLILAVNRHGLLLLDQHAQHVVTQFSYFDLISWGYSDRGLVFITGEDAEPIRRSLKTKEAFEINNLITTYVDAIAEAAPEASS